VRHAGGAGLRRGRCGVAGRGGVRGRREQCVKVGRDAARRDGTSAPRRGGRCATGQVGAQPRKPLTVEEVRRRPRVVRVRPSLVRRRGPLVLPGDAPVSRHAIRAPACTKACAPVRIASRVFMRTAFSGVRTGPRHRLESFRL